ncbi:MAG: hypothetical protein ACFE8E_13760 [Candidatus Hodarchaeota archaeon]
MVKKKIPLFFIVYLMIFITSFQYIPIAKGLTESFTDPENDVFRIDFLNERIDKVSDHNQLDIINISLNLDNQFTNVTFLGNITGYDMECSIYLFENYNPSNLIFEYSVYYSNISGTGFRVIFVKYTLSGEEYSFEFWNNTIGWTSSNISADNIGSFSDYTIEATIPKAALMVYDNTTWFALSSSYEGNSQYLDCAPDSFCPIEVTPENFGFEIFLVAAIVIVIIFAFYFIRKKRLKKPLY